MVKTCDRGCLTDGKPTRHANPGACPVIRAERIAAKTQNVPQRSTVPEPSPPGATEPPKPKEPEKSAWDKFVEFVREPAKTVASPDVPQRQESYLLEGEDVVNFWQIVFSLFEFAINGFLRFLGAKVLPPELCDIKGSTASKLLISRNMRHTTSQFFISLGVGTKGEAQALIGEGEGIVSFGNIFLGIGWHLIIEVPKSPRWKEWFPEKPVGAAPASPAGGAVNAWWDPLGVFAKKTEAPASPALAAPA